MIRTYGRYWKDFVILPKSITVRYYVLTVMKKLLGIIYMPLESLAKSSFFTVIVLIVSKTLQNHSYV